ncbi:YD repeat protein [Pseudomonas chlororaphis]|uniref:YD repeat protein n=1 Tax=Pseudomonas chlororaphis TaxID=587753 RepID=A0A3G7TQB9_9PSED|nr:RHS repeat-associated core domain-containing protein [Pseudomonas chlororaphis]AZE49061.1 YD repeat protein [Pseudomonas chlororaphis]
MKKVKSNASKNQLRALDNPGSVRANEPFLPVQPQELREGVPPASIIGFNGQLFDPVSGTYLLGNGYRAYSPTMRAFYSPDSLSPFGSGGVSRYQYCNLNPVNYTDPSGHLASRAGWGIVLGITAIALGVGVIGIFVMPAIAAGTLTLSGSIVAGMAALGAVAGAGAIVTGALAANASSLGISPEGEDSLAWASLVLGISGVVLSTGALALAKANPGLAAAASARMRPVAGAAGRRLDAAHFRTGSEAVTFSRTNIRLAGPPAREASALATRSVSSVQRTFAQTASQSGRAPGTGFSELGSAILSSRKFPIRLGR